MSECECVGTGAQDGSSFRKLLLAIFLERFFRQESIFFFSFFSTSFFFSPPFPVLLFQERVKGGKNHQQEATEGVVLCHRHCNSSLSSSLLLWLPRDNGEGEMLVVVFVIFSLGVVVVVVLGDVRLFSWRFRIRRRKLRRKRSSRASDPEQTKDKRKYENL